MSASERNQYLSPPKAARREGPAPSTTAAGTFGTATRFWESSQSAGHAMRARSPLGYVPSMKGAASATPARQRGYAEMAMVRANVAPAGKFAPRSKTPAATRPAVRPSGTYGVPERRAATPPSSVPRQYGIPAARSPAVSSRPTMVAVGPSSSGNRQLSQPQNARGMAFDTATIFRSPGWAHHALTPGPAISPVFPDSGRPSTTWNPTSKVSARRLTYGESPYTAVRGATGDAMLPLPRSRPEPTTATHADPTGVRGRFQDPGDDWLSSYDRSSTEVLRELDRILGGLSRLSSIAPAPMEARAPPRQLPSQADLPSLVGGPSLAQVQFPPGSSAGRPLSHGGTSSYLGPGSDVQGVAWSGTNQTTPDTAGPRPAWADSASPMVPAHLILPTIHSRTQPSTMATLLATYPVAAGMPGGPGFTPATAVTAAAPAPATTAVTTAFPMSPFMVTVPSEDFPNQASTTYATRTGPKEKPSGTSASQPIAVGSSEGPATAAVQSAGATSCAAPGAPLPPNTVAEFWNVLQACNQHTTRLMVDLATARREAEIANERAEEADSLVRAFQQQLIARQKGVAAWQTAIVEMEEREAAARRQLLELQERCDEQVQRAQHAEHVAATAQLRLEQLMAAQKVGQPEAGSSAGTPSPQLQQQLDHLQADLAAAQTRATRAELELAVVRNKALIAQQELSAEEDRARRAAAAASAARQELARTRTAIEMMGLDHDQVQNQLADLRGKVGDAVRLSGHANSRDLFIHLDQKQQPQQAECSQLPLGSSALPTAAQAAAATRSEGPRRSSRSGIARAAAGAVESVAESPCPGGSLRGTHMATPNSSGDSTRALNRPSLLLAQSSAARSVNSSNSSADLSRSSSPSRRDTSSAPRRRRRGSVLLVPPREMPVETSASVRYGQRLSMRRPSRSQDAGVIESPSGGDDEPDGLMSGRSPGADSRMRSQRAMSGSHDGVVQELSMAAGEPGGTNMRGGGGITVVGSSPRVPKAVGRNVEGNSSDQEEAKVSDSPAGVPLLLRTTGSLRRGVGVTEEMLPLTRSPSSGVRRRLPSLRMSHGSISRDVAPSVARTITPLNHSSAPMVASDSLAATGSVQKPLPVAPTVSASERAQPERGAVDSTRTEMRRELLPAETARAATASRPMTTSSMTSTTAAEPQPSQQQQSRQGSRTVSLADLRRQMATAATCAAPDASQATQEQKRTGSFGQRGTAEAIETTAAYTPNTAISTTRTSKATGVAAGAGEETRSPESRPKQQLLLRELRANLSQQPTPTAPAHAAPAANLPTANANTPAPATRSTSRRFLPTLAESNSPPERHRNAISGDIHSLSLGPSPLGPSSGAGLHPGLRAAAAAVVAAKAATSCNDAAPGPALQMTPSFRTHTSALSPRRGSAMATVMDTRPPQGFNTSHINDLYESMQSRGSWGFVRESNVLAAPPRGFLVPPLQVAVSAPPLRSQVHSQLSALRLQDQVGNSLTDSTSGSRSGVGSAIHAESPPASRLRSVFTSRTRMLSPDQIDSFVVNPSLTSSMTAAATVASIEGSLPAASTVQLWRQPRTQQPHPAVSALPPAVSTADQEIAPVSKRTEGLPGRSPSAMVISHMVNSEDTPPRSPSVAVATVTATAVMPSSTGACGSCSVDLDRCASGPTADNATAVAGEIPRPGRRPWWHWLVPRRTKGRKQRPKPLRPTCSGPSTPTPGHQDSGHSSLLAMRRPTGSESRALSPQTPTRPGSGEATGHTRSSATVAGQLRSRRGVDQSEGDKPPTRSGGGASGGAGRGRLLLSALLQFGVWSGGMAVGVVLVMGLAGLVEGTLGLGAGAGPPPAGLTAVPGGEPCCCPGTESPKRDGQDRGKDPWILSKLDFRLS